MEDNIIKNVKNFFRLKKEIDGTTIKDIRNRFGLKIENESIKQSIDKILTNKIE